MPLTQALSDCKVTPLNPMARGRIISQSISNSRKVAEVSDQSALLFTWIQPHTDDYGRIEGGADDVLFSIVPRRGWTEEQVESYLKELWAVGLLKAYHENGKRYLEVYGFEEHQTFRSDRGRKAKCPVPNEYDSQWYTKDNQREKTDSEVKLSKVKLSQAKSKRSVDTQEVSADATPVKEEKPKTITPKEKALQFFEGVIALQQKQEVPWLQEFLNAIVEKNKETTTKRAIWNEILAFTSYWTELNGTGTRQKWTLQKTFEVERRLLTWFSRAGFKNFSASGFNKASKGKEIIGLDEDDNATE